VAKRGTRGRLVLRLYVAGAAPNSVRAIANARALCDEHFPTCKLEIVDLLLQPKRAAADGIIVTPTLLKLSPRPIQRVVGSLDDRERLLTLLEGS